MPFVEPSDLTFTRLQLTERQDFCTPPDCCEQLCARQVLCFCCCSCVWPQQVTSSFIISLNQFTSTRLVMPPYTLVHIQRTLGLHEHAIHKRANLCSCTRSGDISDCLHNKMSHVRNPREACVQNSVVEN